MGILKDKTAYWNRQFQSKVEELRKRIPIHDNISRYLRMWAKNGEKRDFDISISDSLFSGSIYSQINIHLGTNDNLKKDAMFVLDEITEIFKSYGIKIITEKEDDVRVKYSFKSTFSGYDIYFNISNANCREVRTKTTEVVETVKTTYVCD